LAGKRRPSKRQLEAARREVLRRLADAPDDLTPEQERDALLVVNRNAVELQRAKAAERLAAAGWQIHPADRPIRLARRTPSYDAARVRGSTRHTDDDRWLAMRESGASSMKAYAVWQQAPAQHGATLSNGKPIPSWKSIERRFLPQAKPGETAWQAAERLGRKAGKL
jgi:hypothetical protein